jgi:hypothetical protein
MKSNALVLLLAFVVTAVSAASVDRGKPRAFRDFLAREKLHTRAPEARAENVKKLAIDLFDGLAKKIEKIPPDLFEVEAWSLTLALPKRSESPDLWVSACETQYQKLKGRLRARYDELRKTAKGGQETDLFEAFALSQAVLAAAYAKHFTETYARHYAELNL